MKSPQQMWADCQAGAPWPVISELIYSLYETAVEGEDGLLHALWEVTQLGRDDRDNLLPYSATWEEFCSVHLQMARCTAVKYKRVWEVYHVKLGFGSDELASVGVFVLGKVVALLDRQLRSGSGVDLRLLERLFGDPGYRTYFVGDEHGRVKIGRARFVDIRLSALQVASADRLVLLYVVDGDREDEFHRMFATDHIRGEWFRFSHRMAQFLLDAGCEGVWCGGEEDWGYTNQSLSPTQLPLGV